MTAEFALAVPAVILVLAAMLSGLQVAGQQLRLQDAAALAARSLARGEAIGTVQGRADRLVPGVRITSWTQGDLVCGTASAGAPGLVGALLATELSASSCALGGGR